MRLLRVMRGSQEGGIRAVSREMVEGKVSSGCCGEARAVMQSAKREGSLRLPGDCEGGPERGAGM